MARQTKQPLSEVSNQSGVFPEKKSTFKSVCVVLNANLMRVVLDQIGLRR